MIDLPGGGINQIRPPLGDDMETPLDKIKYLARELSSDLDHPLNERTRTPMVDFKTKLMVQQINQLREAYNLELYAPARG